MRLGLLAVGTGLVIGGEAFGYRCFWRTEDDSPLPVAAPAARRDPAVWGAGTTLYFVVGDSPRWTEPREDARGEEQEPMLTRLRPDAIRNELDSLLDGAARRELNLRGGDRVSVWVVDWRGLALSVATGPVPDVA